MLQPVASIPPRALRRPRRRPGRTLGSGLRTSVALVLPTAAVKHRGGDSGPFSVRAVSAPHRPPISARARSRRAQSPLRRACSATPLGRVDDSAPEQSLPVSPRPTSVQNPVPNQPQEPRSSSATAANWNIHAGQGPFAPSTLATSPNPRAAESFRSGKVDDSTGQNERFRRSEACTVGAGGTRTHGRRIMSPLRILAALVDLRSSWPFYQVRRGLTPQSFPALVSLFFQSLCPTCVQNASWKDKPNLLPRRSPSSGVCLELARSGFLFHCTEAPPRNSGRSLCGRLGRPRHLCTDCPTVPDSAGRAATRSSFDGDYFRSDVTRARASAWAPTEAANKRLAAVLGAS